MRDYHFAWLAKHPERSEEWLQDRLRDGFDIHHADGDRTNNAPENLVLIEGSDHMMLHGHSLRRRLRGLEEKRAKAQRDRELIGKRAYEAKSSQVSWAIIGGRLDMGGGVARDLAKKYADAKGLPFPKPNSACRATQAHRALLREEGSPQYR